jgi:hypothetical protein
MHPGLAWQGMALQRTLLGANTPGAQNREKERVRANSDQKPKSSGKGGLSPHHQQFPIRAFQRWSRALMPLNSSYHPPFWRPLDSLQDIFLKAEPHAARPQDAAER